MRVRWGALLAAAMTVSVAAALVAQAPVSAGDGRYKVGPKGECYWDARDNGPDQCKPPEKKGRYKKDGNRCYWDANDSGPNQCEPPAGQPR